MDNAAHSKNFPYVSVGTAEFSDRKLFNYALNGKLAFCWSVCQVHCLQQQRRTT